MKQLVYIAHPLGSGEDREANRKSASKWFAWACEQGVLPIAPWIILSGVWDESRREEGLKIDFEQIERCDQLWLCGPRISPGMELEAKHARSVGVDVVDLTESLE